MGGSQSTRSIVVDNRNPVALQLSEAAARRALAPDHSEPSSAQEAPHPEPFRPHYDYSGEEEYWTKRIDSLKKAHQSIKNKMNEEYDKSISETTQMFQRAQTSTSVGKLPPCQPEKAAVLKCYNANSTQPLLCAEFVNSFNECVSNKRSETTATGA